MGMSQICTGADHYFRPSKPHSGKLCIVSMQHFVELFGVYSIIKAQNKPCDLIVSSPLGLVALPSSWSVIGR